METQPEFPLVKRRPRRGIWSCKCGKTVALQYEEFLSRGAKTATGGYRYDSYRLSREVDGKTVTWSEDSATPCACGRFRKGAVVVGRRTERACNALCLHATGGTCNCACGGANHGRAYAIEQQS